MSSTQFADAAQAQQWFEVVAAGVASLDPDASWDDAAAYLRERAAAAGLDWAAEALIAHLAAEGGDPTGVLRELGDREREEEYVSAAVIGSAGDAASDAGADAGGGYDDAAWSAYVGRWQGGWDGAEATWPQFRDGFVQSAGAGLQEAAQDLVAYAEASGDKATALAPYGIAAAASADAAASPGAAAPAAEPEAEHRAEPAAEPPAEPAEADEVTEAVAALDIQDDTIAAVLQENPEFAALGAEALEQLMSEVLAELETEEEAS